MSNYAIPQFSITDVNKSCKSLISLDGSPEELSNAINVIDNWRASHAYPLLIFYQTLKNRATRIHKTSLVAQRTKRLISILDKLKREENMKLSQMQDIGGCRAVLGSLEQVRNLEQVYLTSRWEHEEGNHKDYIKFPKPSGYRGIHLKYKYKGMGEKSSYNGLKIEIQLRTNLQHIWATAVETAGTFLKQALKSNIGHESWLRFFSLMSSVFAIRENSPIVPGTSKDLNELVSEIRAINESHQIVNSFAGTTAVLSHIQQSKYSVYFLVSLDPDKLTVEIKSFKKNESQAANKAYTELEKNCMGTNINVVLVSSSSVKALERAYPNYFLDAGNFLREVQTVCDGRG